MTARYETADAVGHDRRQASTGTGTRTQVGTGDPARVSRGWLRRRLAATRPAGAGPCRYCGRTSYRADDHGTVHECCLAWQHVMSSGYPCPACQIAENVLKQLAAMKGDPKPVRLPHLPPLPSLLPDGTPYVSDPAPVPRCAACGHVMTVIIPGQRCHPLCADNWAGARLRRVA